MSRNGKVETWAEVYQKFEGRCEYLGVKPSTMEQYSRTVGRFVAWADDEGIDPSGIEPQDVSSYLENLKRDDGQAYSANSRRAYARTVKTLLNYAFDEKIIPQKIKVLMPKAEDDKVKALNDQELAAAIACVEARAEEGFPRDAAIVHVLKDSGVRAGELCALTWKDIFWDEDRQLGTVKVSKQLNRKREIVPTKNGKPRETFFYADAWKYLREAMISESIGWIEDKALTTKGWSHKGWADPVAHDLRGPIFGRAKGSNHLSGRLGNSGLAYMLEQVGEEIGVALHPHLFRHTAGRLMTIAGLSPIVISQVLGHSDLAMVMRYSRLWGPDIANVVAEAMTGNGKH